MASPWGTAWGAAWASAWATGGAAAGSPWGSSWGSSWADAWGSSVIPLSNAEFREMYNWLKELHRIHGLTSGVNLVVTPTSRTAGAITQTIGEVGTTVTVTRT